MLAGTAAYAQTELTVYSAVEAEDLQRYAETFNKDHPDIPSSGTTLQPIA